MKSNTLKLAVGSHQGKSLMRIAKTYPSLPKATLEVVQNSIDAGAQRIEVKIDLQRRTLDVYDDGSGCGPEKFKERLLSFEDSIVDPKKYGQFKRGMVAPLAIADEGFTFTSCEHPHRDQYYQYVFDPQKIEAARQVVIEGRLVDGLVFNPKGKTWWRTAIEARKITKDRRLSELKLDDLLDDIALKYGEAIRTRNIAISITLTDEEGVTESRNVIAAEYTGEKIETAVMESTETGKTIIDLYVARLGRQGRRGTIVIGTTGSPSRIPVHDFLANVRSSKLLNSHVANGLSSGLFEGKILCEKLTLDPDRTRFEDNDALAVMCMQLEEWWEKTGKDIVTELQEQDSEIRFQKFGEDVMPFTKLLLKQERFQGVVESIRVGTVGAEHTEVDGRQILGPDQGGTSVAEEEGPGSKKKKKGGDSGDGPHKPTKERPRHRPIVSYGPRGKRRTEVIDSSTGLRFRYEEMLDIKTPFTFEPATGTVTFNLDHPDWEACETNNKVVEYEMAVISSALTMERHKNTSHPELADYTYALLHEQVFIIVNGEGMKVKK